MNSLAENKILHLSNSSTTVHFYLAERRSKEKKIETNTDEKKTKQNVDICQ